MASTHVEATSLGFGLEVAVARVTPERSRAFADRVAEVAETFRMLDYPSKPGLAVLAFSPDSADGSTTEALIWTPTPRREARQLIIHPGRHADVHLAGFSAQILVAPSAFPYLVRYRLTGSGFAARWSTRSGEDAAAILASGPMHTRSRTSGASLFCLPTGARQPYFEELCRGDVQAIVERFMAAPEGTLDFAPRETGVTSRLGDLELPPNHPVDVLPVGEPVPFDRLAPAPDDPPVCRLTISTRRGEWTLKLGARALARGLAITNMHTAPVLHSRRKKPRDTIEAVVFAVGGELYAFDPLVGELREPPPAPIELAPTGFAWCADGRARVSYDLLE
ncbi:MAG: hypothetical protein RIT45_4047 [Pseudomonadota bacterium]|jgi:hypothetical protein